MRISDWISDVCSSDPARPGLYTVRKGETLSSLIERAGGLTRFAYPYGAVMTRRSVQKAEEEGYRRTSRDLGNAVLSIAARKTVNADSLAAVTQISTQLASAEGAGDRQSVGEGKSV